MVGSRTTWCLPRGVSANVYNEPCPSRQVLDRIADKWSMLVTGALSQQTQRFGGLRREVPGISAKMLTATLRGLEQDGLVHRRQYPTIPPKVEYSLTPLGHSLEHVHGLVRQWAEANVEAIETARLRYADREPEGD